MVQPINIENYLYDKNIADLQVSLEGSKQITTDVLAHKAHTRYFKFDVTVMYSRGSNSTEVNAAIRDSVDRFLRSQYFGSILQLSDILDVIHNVSGVDNVRWSSDLPNNEDLARVYECDYLGNPLLNMTVDKVIPGAAGTVERQRLYLTGQPAPYVWSFNTTSGGSSQNPSYLSFSYNSVASSGTALISSANLAASIQTQLQTIPALSGVTVTEDTRTTTNVKDPIRSFTVVWPGVGSQSLITPLPFLKGGPTVISNDFALRDSEIAALPTGTQSSNYYGSNNQPLPADSVAGLIIRTRAQNTFLRA
jgi:hypothetical protein